jgi:hypothetical protein
LPRESELFDLPGPDLASAGTSGYLLAHAVPEGASVSIHDRCQARCARYYEP